MKKRVIILTGVFIFIFQFAVYAQGFQNEEIQVGSKLSPLIQPHSSGEEFYIDIEVQNVSDLFGISFRLNFPSEYLEAISSEHGAFLGSQIIFYNNISNENGTVSVGISKTGSQSGSSGSGILARIKLKDKASVPDGTIISITLTEVTANDPTGNSIGIMAVDASYVVNSSSSYIMVAVGDHQLHEEFDIRVNVENVYDLFGVSFKLNFPADKLEILSTEKGDFLGSSVIYYDNIDNGNGTVSIGISKTGSQAGSNGTGTLAKIIAKEKGSVVGGTEISINITELTAVDNAGNSISLVGHEASYIVTLVESELFPKAESFQLFPNYPNPFNPSTTITYSLPRSGQVYLQLYDLRGCLVKSLVNGAQEPGMHSVQWDATNDNGEHVASGVYICHLRAGTTERSIKIIYTK